MRRISDTWSWMDFVLPFVAMLMVTCLDMTELTLLKAALNDGMDTIVYVVYHSALGTLILLPVYIVHIIRKVDRPPLTLRILFRFFILGLFGICLFQVLVFAGVDYSSPTMTSAITNLSPGVTFLITVFFRMEKIDIKSSSSLAKVLATVVAISGAMVLTFYQGPAIFATPDPPNNHLLLSQSSNWIFGALLTFIGGTFGCLWTVLLTTASREYSDQQTIVFFCCLFGTIQCMALSPFLEQNLSAWVIQNGTGVTAVVFGALNSIVFKQSIVTWCLRKKGPIFVAMFSPLSIVIAVILGVTFLGDSLHLGSAIGATIIVGGFYTFMWAQTQEKNKISVVMDDDLDVSRSSADQTAPLLSSRNESEC